MCDPGTFNNAKGQPRCFLCKIGTYSALPGASVCTRCKEGSAGPEDGLRECPPCERGQFASYVPSLVHCVPVRVCLPPQYCASP